MVMAFMIMASDAPQVHSCDRNQDGDVSYSKAIESMPKFSSKPHRLLPASSSFPRDRVSKLCLRE